MATLLLVHGAWHGSWCWAKVASVLADRGVSAVALDLPGRTGDEAPVEQLTLENYARKVCQIAASQNRPVILVGHSLGGMIISQAAEFHSEPIMRNWHRAIKGVSLRMSLFQQGASFYGHLSAEPRL
ncbi:MAG: alpha/beta fold hydrolase, partial [Chloroflexi bacterium]|nr:alpha/beta fold hydrolase [Chloroflexota bacterium]